MAEERAFHPTGFNSLSLSATRLLTQQVCGGLQGSVSPRSWRPESQSPEVTFLLLSPVKLCNWKIMGMFFSSVILKMFNF